MCYLYSNDDEYYYEEEERKKQEFYDDMEKEYDDWYWDFGPGSQYYNY